MENVLNKLKLRLNFVLLFGGGGGTLNRFYFFPRIAYCNNV